MALRLIARPASGGDISGKKKWRGRAEPYIA